MSVRDKRWANATSYLQSVYDIDENISFVRLAVEVNHEGMFYWQHQDFFEGDESILDDWDVFRFIMNEMVGLVDGRMSAKSDDKS